MLRFPRAWSTPASSRKHSSSVACRARHEVRICTNKVCKKQGSEQLVKFGQDLGVVELDVVSCGCLGNCGNGPNMVVLPDEVVLNHVATPADLAEVLRWQCQLDVPEEILQATQLRLAGNDLVRDANLEGAVSKYTQGLQLLEAARCMHGRHLLYSNRSAALLTLGRHQEALQDAQAAVEAGPPGWQTAWLRLIDAYYVLQRYRDAATALEQVLKADRGFKQTREYKAIAQALERQGLRLVR